MQINAGIGAHTLQLFGIQSRVDSKPAIDLLGSSVSSSFNAPVSGSLGIYADPKLSASSTKQSGGIPQATLDALQSYQDTDMRAVREAMQAKIEATLGRKLDDPKNFGQLIAQVSDGELPALSSGAGPSLMDYSAHEGLLDGIRSIQERRDFSFHTRNVKDLSTEEMVDISLGMKADAALHWLDHMKKVVLSASTSVTPEMKSALAASSDEEVGKMRAEMIQAYRDDIKSGAMIVTRTEEGVSFRRTDTSSPS